VGILTESATSVDQARNYLMYGHCGNETGGERRVIWAIHYFRHWLRQVLFWSPPFVCLHFAWVVDDAKCMLVMRVCLSACLSVCLSLHFHTTARTRM